MEPVQKTVPPVGTVRCSYCDTRLHPGSIAWGFPDDERCFCTPLCAWQASDDPRYRAALPTAGSPRRPIIPIGGNDGTLAISARHQRVLFPSDRAARQALAMLGQDAVPWFGRDGCVLQMSIGAWALLRNLIATGNRRFRRPPPT